MSSKAYKLDSAKAKAKGLHDTAKQSGTRSVNDL